MVDIAGSTGPVGFSPSSAASQLLCIWYVQGRGRNLSFSSCTTEASNARSWQASCSGASACLSAEPAACAGLHVEVDDASCANSGIKGTEH